MPFVSGFTLRFFEFSIAIAVVDRSRVGPETNVYLGTARACTCERTTITMIDGRPCVIFQFANRKTRARYKFQRALRSKKEEAKSRRGPTNCHEEGRNKWFLILWIIEMVPKHGKSFSLLLCHYALLVFVVVFFFSSSSSFIILGKSRFFLLVLREIDYGLNQSCEEMIIVFVLELRILIS